MDIEQVILEAEHGATAKSVYGDAVEKNGVIVLPVAKVTGGGGLGEGEQANQGEGKGGGFGIHARATGVYVIDENKVTWKPAVDWNKIIIGAQAVVIAALLTMRSVAKIHARTRRKELRKGVAE